MEPMTLNITNDITMIPVAQAAAAAYCRAAGTDEEIARQTELVIEEIVTNIIQYEYLPDQRETISLILSVHDGVLELLIRFRGIPFDVAYLQQCEKKTDIEEIVRSNGRGMGLLLISRFSDEVRYRNLGWQGQEISIRRSVTAAGSRSAPAARIMEAPPEAYGIAIRRMSPGDAAAISRLAYFAYRYTYIREELYDPEQVLLRNADGRMTSYVIVNENSGEIIGHMALFPDELSDAPELAAGFVHPHSRGSGSFNALTELMVQDAQAAGWQGVCGMAVTSHFYSQLAALRMGMTESTLFVSRVQPLAFTDIREQALFRESLLYLFRLFDRNSRLPYCVPHRHREMIAKIVMNASLNVTFNDARGEIPLPEQGEIETRTDIQKSGHIILRSWGSDSLEQIRKILRRWCLDRQETIYLYLPLTCSATALFCPDVEEMGFFFAGIIPGIGGADLLVLQYLNNQRYDYGLLKAATPFGNALIDYVRSCDPNTGD